MNILQKLEVVRDYRLALLQAAGAAQDAPAGTAGAALAAALGVVDVMVGQGGPAGIGALAGTPASKTVFFGRRHSAAGPREARRLLEAAAELAQGCAIISIGDVGDGRAAVAVYKAWGDEPHTTTMILSSTAKAVLAPAFRAAGMAARLRGDIDLGSWWPEPVLGPNPIAIAGPRPGGFGHVALMPPGWGLNIWIDCLP